ncbi:hypothetical protein FEK48_13215 [Escherichia sp. E2593]|nr:hypothetical protein FEK48_13215 [Escherichia sp. E2593]
MLSVVNNNRCMAHAAIAVRRVPCRVPFPSRVAGMCKPGSLTALGRFTIVAIRCDTSEETRMQ